MNNLYKNQDQTQTQDFTEETQNVFHSYFQKQKYQKVNISIIKHLSKPLQIRQTQNSLQLAQPICYYSQKLTQLSQKLFPSQQNTKQVTIQQTKLMRMQNAQFQFNQIKRNFQRQKLKLQKQRNNQNGNNQQEDNAPYNNKVKTLFNNFYLKVPYYCRFQNHKLLRSNFANAFINVCGINLECKISKNDNKLPKLLNNQKRFNSGPLIFDSHFQSGNLLYVYENPCERDSQNTLIYNLILQNDTNTYGHNQWFFFRVQSNKPHLNVRLNIINLIKGDSLFNYGLKPLVFSERQNQKSQIGWIRRGQNIRYFQNDIRRQNKKSFYYTLSFQYFFKQAKDWIYFCPSYPYTYTQMTNFIQKIYIQPKYKNCFSLKTLNHTIGKNKINLITISTGQKPIQQCKIVWILARQHPTQTTSNYMVQGIIKYLLPLISTTKNSNTQSLNQLNNYVFKILPIINVDGVIHGNSRAGLNGLDPNRCWKKPKKSINPDNWHIIKQIIGYKQNITLILDLHSHSKKTGCFFYGNQLGLNSKINKIFPTLVCQNDERFCLKNCRFRGGYKTTARHILHQNIKIQNIFTVECSLLGYLKNNRVVQYTIQDYQQMGAKLIQTYLKFQNFKVHKNITQIINEYSELTQQICQVDSARSDSQISQDQYQQIKQLQKKCTKTKAKSVSIKPIKKKVLGQNVNNITHGKEKRQCYHSKDQKKDKSCKKYNIKCLHIDKKQNIMDKIKNKNSFQISYKSQLVQKIQNDENKNEQKLINFKEKKQQNKTKNSYLKILKNMNIYSEKLNLKNNPVEIKKNINGKNIAIQVFIPNQKILSNSDQNITDQRFRPLCVLGNPCQSEFTLYNKNQVALQVSLNEKQDQTKKQQQKTISKFPKLINLLNSSKNKKISYKENNFYETRNALLENQFLKDKNYYIK